MFGEVSQLDLTFPLESAHGFGQENGASELRRNPHHTTKASGRNFQKLRGRRCFNLYFIKIGWPKPNQSNVDNREDDNREDENTSEADILNLKPL